MSKVYPGGKINPKEFYLKTYGVEITDKDIEETYASTKTNYVWIWVIVLIVILLIGLFVWINFIKKNVKTQPQSN
jgi:cytoskeletal protein RodZ